MKLSVNFEELFTVKNIVIGAGVIVLTRAAMAHPLGALAGLVVGITLGKKIGESQAEENQQTQG